MACTGPRQVCPLPSSRRLQCPGACSSSDYLRLIVNTATLSNADCALRLLRGCEPRSDFLNGWYVSAREYLSVNNHCGGFNYSPPADNPRVGDSLNSSLDSEFVQGRSNVRLSHAAKPATASQDFNLHFIVRGHSNLLDATGFPTDHLSFSCIHSRMRRRTDSGIWPIISMQRGIMRSMKAESAIISLHKFIPTSSMKRCFSSWLRRPNSSFSSSCFMPCLHENPWGAS